MSLIKKPNELQAPNNLKILIYGQPGLGKSTLALSAPSPLLIDLDNGLTRVGAQWRTDSVQVKDYQEVLDILNSSELNNYQTIIIDTIGKLIDKIADFAAKQNPKLRQVNGQLSIPGWGVIKQHFTAFFKLLETKNLSIIFVAHEKEEKNNEIVYKRPDIAGSSGKDINKELDLIGYMQANGNRRTIDFQANEQFYAKNALGLTNYLEFETITGKNDWLQRNVFEVNRKRLLEEANLSNKYNELIELHKSNIDELLSIDDVNTYYNEHFGKLEKIWSSHEFEKQLLWDKCKSLGLTFDSKAKRFIAGAA